jgi:nitrite reductase/ring-hydroxylating ferredoxin subunit/uncharacterized membrane protein
MSDTGTTARSAIDRIETARVLDRAADALVPLADAATRSRTLKRYLSGAPIGHRLHPLLTDIPIGCWTSATLLDVSGPFAGSTRGRAARCLTGVGLLASLPTIASGLSDWRDTHGGSRRVGVVHLAANLAMVVCEARSWWWRRHDRHGRGTLWGLAGVAAGTVGGYLGGHLVFAQRVGVDVDVPTVPDTDWHDVCRADSCTNGPHLALVGGIPVAVVQRAGRVYALAATCSHAGGPLHEGTLEDSCLRCPWHGSEFDVRDGRVVRGPAAAPQPVYDVRVRSGRIEIRRTHRA